MSEMKSLNEKKSLNEFSEVWEEKMGRKNGQTTPAGSKSGCIDPFALSSTFLFFTSIYLS